MTTNIKLDINNKINISITTVVIFLILSIILAVYNCIMIALQTI